METISIAERLEREMHACADPSLRRQTMMIRGEYAEISACVDPPEVTVTVARDDPHEYDYAQHFNPEGELVRRQRLVARRPLIMPFKIIIIGGELLE
jgi:hypothetical protein